MSNVNYESEQIVLNLPLSPSVNDTYGLIVKSGRPIKFVKTKGKKFFAEVNEYIQENDFDIQANVPLKVEIIISFKTNHRNDLDNRLKSLFDSLTKANVWEDDALINEIHVIRGQNSKNGGIIIKIQEYKND